MTPKDKSKAREEIFCILLPLVTGKLLLPRSLIEGVRILRYSEPLLGTPEWLPGLVTWQGNRVPLVAYEALMGAPAPAASKRSRMVVLRTPDKTLDPPVLAIHAQGFPYILRITPNLKAAITGRLGEYILAVTELGLEQPIIPDIYGLANATAEVIAEARIGLD